MAKRQKTPDPIILPDLSVVSFGDMMTLMLTFFVLLFSMSEMRRERIVATINNFKLGQGIFPHQKSPMETFVKSPRLTQRQARMLREATRGRDPDQPTRQPTQHYTVVLRGEANFERDGTYLTDAARLRLRDAASMFQGRKNIIEVRGHTAAAGDDARDPWDYAMRRAYNTMRFLVDQGGLEEERFRLVSCGDAEPLDPHNPDANRRVEIVMTDRLMPEGYE